METITVAPKLGFAASCITVCTDSSPQFIDITDDVQRHVESHGFRNGLVAVTTQHTTAGIIVNEHEPELIKDLTRLLQEIAPVNGDYAHNVVPCEPYERPNGHSHCQALFLSSSVSIPLVEGTLMLGRFQRVFVVELDGPRKRQISIAALAA